MDSVPEEKIMPVYEPVRDWLLVGVGHSTNPLEFPEQTREFLRQIDGSMHFVGEGNKQTLDNRMKNSRTYEGLAASRFMPGSRYFLEGRSDWGALAERYGMRADLFWMYYTLNRYEADQSTSGEKTNTEVLDDVLTVIRGFVPGGKQADAKLLRSRIGLLGTNFEGSETERVYDLAMNASIRYFAKIRDFEIFGPEALKLDTQLTGKKLGIMGGKHLPHLAKVLRGEEVHPPLQWRAFAETLEPEMREMVETIEDKIFAP
ncbi:MAG: hypothetical protein Q7S65_03010 [Nanoarchaeota archaeon]|nr:hypothetical protein [Nanoarchaeota archaeon]